MSSVANDDDYLESSWTLYFHDPNDKRWDLASYQNLFTMFTASDFWGAQEPLSRDNAIGKGMWFIMRGDIFPCWDDAANIDGGCMSFILNKTDIADAWADFCEIMMCERLVKDGEDCEIVNGISVSPKNDFCILKLWLTREVASNDLEIPLEQTGIFKSNRTKIANDRVM